MKKFFTLKNLIIILIASAVLSALIIFLVCDAFALTAEDGEITVSIPAESTKGEISAVLKENGLIKSRAWFHLYTAIRGKPVASKGQTYTFQKGSGFDGICHVLANGSSASGKQIRVSIPEGATISTIMKIVCDEHEICSREDFIDAVQNGDFSKYSFTEYLTETKDRRKYRLEGYLYPDTYYFYAKSSANEVIDKMLQNFDRKFDKKYASACKKQGLTIDEAVTMASLIIREAKYIQDYPKVSSVFYNRLNSTAFGRRLQSDATTVYLLEREMTPEDKEIDSPYNTYKYSGLPPSPIASPDLNAISYAVYPDKTGYYYFVTKKDGTVLYARDYQTHLYNVKKASE